MDDGRVGGTLPEDQGTAGEGVRRPEFWSSLCKQMTMRPRVSSFLLQKGILFLIANERLTRNSPKIFLLCGLWS